MECSFCFVFKELIIRGGREERRYFGDSCGPDVVGGVSQTTLSGRKGRLLGEGDVRRELRPRQKWRK